MFLLEKAFLERAKYPFLTSVHFVSFVSWHTGSFIAVYIRHLGYFSEESDLIYIEGVQIGQSSNVVI